MGIQKRGMCFSTCTVPVLIRATKTAIGHRSPISFLSVIDPSNQSIKPVIASHDHRTVTVFTVFVVFFVNFTHLHNVIDLNINSDFNFTFRLFQTDLTSFYITKLQSDW